MANILFLVVENLRQYRRSPLLEGSVLHLVYESARHNNGMHPTADTLPVINLNLAGRRVMPGVMTPLRVPAKLWAASAPLRAAGVERYPDGWTP